MDNPTEVTVVATDAAAGAAEGSYVDWPAIIAGIVLASAISLLLLTFGSALGLSFVNFDAAEDVNPIWIGIAAATWLLWVEISSFMCGGYLTGRLRRRRYDASEHESDVRDGAHGLLVWGGGLIVGALLALGGLGATAGAVGGAASAITEAAGNAAGDIGDATGYFADMLLRPAAPAEGSAAATPPAGGAATPATPPAGGAAAPVTPPANVGTTPAPSATPADTSAAREEIGRILTRSAVTGSVSDDDKAYLGQIVAANTGMSQDEANARVDQVLTAIDDAKAQAADVAEKTRRTTVLAAFLTAAALLVSAVGAYWAAQMGGRHRDEGTEFADVFRRF
jgi:hypothetical protein